MVDVALIDADHDGEIFNIARSDVAESEDDLVAGCCLNRTRSVFLLWKPEAAVFPEIRWFIAWTTMLLVAAGMGSGIWLGYRLGLTPSLDDVMLFLGFGATALVGTLLVAKRPGNLIGWIMATIGGRQVKSRRALVWQSNSQIGP